METIILIDFAQTLGFRSVSEKEVDLGLLRNSVGGNFCNCFIRNVISESALELNIYDRTPKFFSDLSNEYKFYEDFFCIALGNLKKHTNKKFLTKSLAKKLSKEHIKTKQYSLFDDVVPFLNFLQDKNIKVYVVTDGKPSRGVCIEKLGIGKYFQKIFTSDSLRQSKVSPVFFQKILCDLKINTKNAKIILVDDQITSLKSAKRLGISGVLLDRESKYDAKTKEDFLLVKSLSEIVKYL